MTMAKEFLSVVICKYLYPTGVLSHNLPFTTFCTSVIPSQSAI